jgi:hypothetical protein
MRQARLALAAAWMAAAGVAMIHPQGAQAQTMYGPTMPAPMSPPMTMPDQRPFDPSRVEFYSGAPVFTPGDEGGLRAAARNNAESRRYEAALRDSPAFRQQRIQQECGTFGNAGVYQRCVDSFGHRTAAAER